MSEPTFYAALLYGWLGLAVVTFASLFFVTAPYGRHARSGWGPTVDATIGWVVMELPAMLVILFFFLIGDRRGSPVAICLLVLWEVHYVHRALVFPFLRPRSDRRTPWVIVFMALLFNVVNGYLNGRHLFSSHISPDYPSDWLLRPTFLIGAALFVVGFVVNLHSDRVLFRLREPGETGYKIPRGGLFRWVSSPNYFGELLEWTGWAIASWSLAGLSFALWTAANLVPRAVSHHRWYRETFPDYPPRRKAILPFLL